MLRLLSFFYYNYNYGGMLQAYALCSMLHLKCSYCQQTAYIRYTKSMPRFYKRVLHLTIKKLFYKIFNIGMNFLLYVKYVKRKDKFYKFQELCVPHSEVYNTHNISESVATDDIFIAGSDQIWNPAWTEDAYFLNFVPDHNGKIAYAASIGANEVSQDFLEHVVPYLRRFDFISVREESAKEILQPYLDQEIKVTLDPTLLLPREEWDKIAVQPMIPQPYIFVYLLGEKRAHRRLIKKFARTLGLKIAFLPHVHFHFNPADCFFADYNLYDVGPAEFVGLVKNAEIVITDSFHGCVFSIIYGRKFWALKRHKDSDPQNMNSRLYTLFRSLGLSDRLIADEDADYDAAYLNKEIDYGKVEKSLDSLRKDSSDFLLNAIETVRRRMENDKNTIQ